MFTMIIKCMLMLFILAGIAAAVYGALEIWKTVSVVETSTGRSMATFAGYYREISKTGVETKRSNAMATYPEFTYRTDDGAKKRVRESKVHVFAYYKPGDEVEILFTSSGYPRMAGFYSLYFRDMLILIIGLMALSLSLIFWNFGLPHFAPPSSAYHYSVDSLQDPDMEDARRVPSEVETVFQEKIMTALDFKAGPLKLRHILYGFGGLFVLMLSVSIIQGLTPFVKQMRFGDRGRMLEAFEHRHFDEVEKMVENGKGIHVKNEFNQNPLLLALEANRPDLARMLIKAGADVNIKSKMYKTPILVATRSRDLETVKLLIAHGATPDTPWDEQPPVFYALAKGYDDIARVLIEASTDLDRRYWSGKERITVEEFARLAKKPDLVRLIRQRNSGVTKAYPQIKEGTKGPVPQTDDILEDAAKEKTYENEETKIKDIVNTDAGKMIKEVSHPQPSPDVNNKVEEITDRIMNIDDPELSAKTEETEERDWEEFTGEVKEIDRDSRFIAYNNGVVEDTKTGLMWACRDNGRDITWEDARAYCENHKRGGYTDWRMPTLNEMKLIYGTGKGYPLNCRPSQSVKITRLITLTGGYPWTIDRTKNLAISFDFSRKLRRSCPEKESENHRALPVRDSK